MSVWGNISKRSENTFLRTEEIAAKKYEQELQDYQKERLKKKIKEVNEAVEKIRHHNSGNYIVTNSSVANRLSEYYSDDPFNDENSIIKDYMIL